MNLSPENRNRRYSPWPIAIIIFFALAITGCIAFIVFCVLHPTDLVSADYYEQEIRYQGKLEKIQRAQNVAGAPIITYNPGQRLITISLPQDHVQSLTSGTVHLYRPSAAHLDRQLKLKPDADGNQHIDAAELTPGLWEVRIDWSARGKGYFLDQKLKI